MCVCVCVCHLGVLVTHDPAEQDDDDGRKGKRISEEHRLNISKGKKGLPNPKNAKPILQYDKNNNLIAEHPSIEQAAISVNGNPTAINNALKKGGEATSSSYIWKYKKVI